LIVLLDNRKAWEEPDAPIPEEAVQNELFGTWRLIYKGKKEVHKQDP
jgi:hypothetical protein